MINNKQKLPANWKWVKLKDVCSEDRQIIEPDTELAKKLPYLSLEHIESETGVIKKDLAVIEDNEGKSTTFSFNSKHVLYGKLRPYLNKVALPDFEGRCTTELMPFLPNDSCITREFLALTLRRKETVETSMKGVTGSRMPRANLKELFQMQIPLPPLSEQKRIAKILSQQLATVEKAQTAAQQQLEAAKSLSNAYLREVFESKEAKKWRLVKLGGICTKISNGTTAEQNSERQGLPVTRIETISSGVIDMTRVGWIDIEQDALNGMRLIDGDILFSHINSVERLGNCAIYSGNPPVLIHGMNLLRFQVNNTVADSQYVLCYLRSNEAKKFYENKAQRAIGQASLNVKVLSTLEIPLPSLPEQKIIVDRLIKQLSATRKTVNKCEEQFEAVNVISSSLLRKAFSGEI